MTQQIKKVWIETYGCQMNINDTEKMYRMLNNADFCATDGPETADLILLNTCTIREKADQKVFSSLGALKRFKDQRPEVMIGVAGCMAQMMGETIRRRAPYVDLVLGTYAINKLPAMIRELQQLRQRTAKLFGYSPTDYKHWPGVVETGKLIPNDFDFLPLQSTDLLTPGPETQATAITKHVTVQNGCNKNCSYCIVPTVRGREVSRPAEQILQEIRQLSERGVREIVLVGQTVNSYGKGSDCDFADLLSRINTIDGIERIRFVTSHPRDLNEKLMETMAKCTKVCEQMHLPVQSGSDAVLKRMYRGYTAAAYLKNIAKLRQFIPNLTLTSDIIVGFPGETEENFQATMALVEAAKFTNSFYFIYSPRPFTKAATWEEQIPEEVAKERLYRLKSLQDRLTIEALNPYLHQEVELLVDGNNHQAEADSSAASLMRPLRGWHGRTRGNWNVHFDLSPEQQLQKGTLVGSLARVKIDRILSHSLQGTLL